jgi:hypothetical protein
MGSYPHEPGGSRQLGRPGEAACAAAAFGLEANKNLKYFLFYLDLIPMVSPNFEQFLNKFKN